MFSANGRNNPILRLGPTEKSLLEQRMSCFACWAERLHARMGSQNMAPAPCLTQEPCSHLTSYVKAPVCSWRFVGMSGLTDLFGTAVFPCSSSGNGLFSRAQSRLTHLGYESRVLNKCETSRPQSSFFKGFLSYRN